MRELWTISFWRSRGGPSSSQLTRSRTHLASLEAVQTVASDPEAEVEAVSYLLVARGLPNHQKLVIVLFYQIV